MSKTVKIILLAALTVAAILFLKAYYPTILTPAADNSSVILDSASDELDIVDVDMLDKELQSL